jgi:SacI homology domain
MHVLLGLLLLGLLLLHYSFTMLFVSRRSCKRQGTRYTRRGIDAEGNVANFVETEQALLHEGGQVCSKKYTIV